MNQGLDYGKLGIKIKEVRQEKGLTQENLAELVGCNTSHISNIENNHTKVSLNVLLAISNALNTSIDYLLSEQYENKALALDTEIIRLLSSFDAEGKKRIIRIINVL
ncbi:MAG: helix-turn-helix domain-containing protein [Anaerovoracaceae bacterium]